MNSEEMLVILLCGVVAGYIMGYYDAASECATCQKLKENITLSKFKECKAEGNSTLDCIEQVLTWWNREIVQSDMPREPTLEEIVMICDSKTNTTEGFIACVDSKVYGVYGNVY